MENSKILNCHMKKTRETKTKNQKKKKKKKKKNNCKRIRI